LPFAIFQAATVVFLLAEDQVSVTRFIVLGAIWIAPSLIYLFAIRSIVMSVVVGLILVVGTREWVGHDFSDVPGSELGIFQALGEGFLLIMVAVAGVATDLMVVWLGNAWRRARRSSSA
jgi:hypothetical protein